MPLLFVLVAQGSVPGDNLNDDVGGKPVALHGPHVLIGTGAVSLLGGTANVSFTNNISADATIEMPLGGNATRQVRALKMTRTLKEKQHAGYLVLPWRLH